MEKTYSESPSQIKHPRFDLSLSSKLPKDSKQFLGLSASKNEASTQYSTLQSTRIITLLTPRSHESIRRAALFDESKIITPLKQNRNQVNSYSTGKMMMLEKSASEIVEFIPEEDQTAKRIYARYPKNYRTEESLRQKETDESVSTEKFIAKLENKYKLFEEENAKKEESISVKIASPHYLKGKKYADDIKKVSIEAMNMKLKIITNKKIIDNSNGEVDKITLETKNMMDKISLEKYKIVIYNYVFNSKIVQY